MTKQVLILPSTSTHSPFSPAQPCSSLDGSHSVCTLPRLRPRWASPGCDSDLTRTGPCLVILGSVRLPACHLHLGTKRIPAKQAQDGALAPPLRFLLSFPAWGVTVFSTSSQHGRTHPEHGYCPICCRPSSSNPASLGKWLSASVSSCVSGTGNGIHCSGLF